MNKTGINIINAASINNYKVNTDVNENISYSNSKHKEIFANLKESASPNISQEKQSYFEVDQDRILLLEQTVNSAPKLEIEVNFYVIIEVINNSTNLRYNLNINAQGVKGSLRNKLDGFTFFGIQNEEDSVRL